MKTLVIKTNCGGVKSDLNIRYFVYDLSDIDKGNRMLTFQAADYYNKNGYYPKKIVIKTFNGQKKPIPSRPYLLLVDTETIGDDTIYTYNYNMDAAVGSNYSPVTYPGYLAFDETTTRIMVEDAGESVNLFFTTTTGKFPLDYNYYTHFPKAQAIITDTMNTDTDTIVGLSGLFRNNMPNYVALELRYVDITMSKEQFLDMIKYCSALNMSTRKFSNGEPTAKEVIDNININYPTAYNDNSTGVWLGLITGTGNELTSEDVADMFVARGARNFYCWHQRGILDKKLIYIDANGDYTITIM